MRNFKYPILFLVFLLGVSGLIFGQKKTSKTIKETPQPVVVSTPQNIIKTTPTPPVVQEETQPDRTPTKRNERPTNGNSSSESSNESKRANENTKANPQANLKNVAGAVYFYEFSQPNFLVSKIRIEHDEQGKGKITFLKKEYEEEISDPVQLTPVVMERIKNAYDALNFLDSTESYQYEKDYSHLGNMKFSLKKDGRERMTEFNWTTNANAKALADEYRKIGHQYVWIFDINLARENQPLNAPRLLDTLDDYVRRNEIADPVQMIPFLKQISNDERIPLIARNHAARLIKDIEKKAQKAEK